MMNTYLLLKRAIGVLAVLLALLAIVLFGLRLSFYSNSAVANGVVDVINKDNATIRVRFKPKAKGDHYLTLEGRKWVRNVHKGDGMVVVYNRDDPNDARIDDHFPFWLLPVFLLLGAVGLAYGYYKLKRWIALQEYLAQRIWKEGGVRIAVFERIDKDRALSTKEQGMWRLVASWTDSRTFEVFEFKSKPLPYYPDEQLIPSTIKIHIHPDEDDKQYEFDPKVMKALQPSPD